MNQGRGASPAIVLAVLTLAAILPAREAESVRRPFTVADSITMNKMIDPEVAYSTWQAPNFKFSADRRRFLVVTQKGNLATGFNEATLMVFGVEDVVSFLNAANPAQLPKPVVLARFESASREAPIVGAKWLVDNETVAFIGRGREGIGQVHVVNVTTGTVRQLTSHPEDISTFDLVSPRGPLIYSAWAMPDWRERNRRGYTVKSENVRSLVLRNPEEAIKDVKHFIADPDAGRTHEVNMQPNIVPRDLWLSPTGRWAVTLSQLKDAPAQWWTEYDSLKSVNRAATKSEPRVEELVGEDVFGMRSAWLVQFMLVDMKTGTAKPLFDAPSGSGLAGLTAKALWSQDDSRVVLVNTFLPLRGIDAQELARRRRSPSIVEVDLETGELSRVVDVPTFDDSSKMRLTSAEWGSAGEIAIEFLSLDDGRLVRKHLRRSEDTWSEEPAPAPTGRLELHVQQGLNTPPEIVAIATGTGRKRAITDLNPQFRNLTLGEVRAFEWSTPDRRKWVGGLVLPPVFKDGARYPLVIQTYGFNSDEFLVDGADGKAAAFAARPLANRGIAVLQMPEDGVGYLGPMENGNQLVLMRAAINALDKRGVIDRSRVGLIGFSRTGMHVQHAITFSDPDETFAAATVCDAASAGYLTYVSKYGYEYPGMLSWERLIGAPFWANGREVWFERSPAFNLHRVRTPLRIEQFGTYVNGYWDTFALLKRHRRPVEMIHIPNASHELTEPLARFTSQEGNVDWFDFWLNDHEDPDPSKAEQYARWRTLRQQQQSLIQKNWTQ